jgi:hypothetical protein
MDVLLPDVIGVEYYPDYTLKYSMDSGGVWYSLQGLCCRISRGIPVRSLAFPSMRTSVFLMRGRGTRDRQRIYQPNNCASFLDSDMTGLLIVLQGGGATCRSSFFRSKRGGGLVSVSPTKDTNGIADDFLDQIVGGINGIERGFGDVMNGGREGGGEEEKGAVVETPSGGGLRFSTQVERAVVEDETLHAGGLIGSIRKFMGGHEGNFGGNSEVDVPGDQRTDRDLITSIRLFMGGKQGD